MFTGGIGALAVGGVAGYVFGCGGVLDNNQPAFSTIFMLTQDFPGFIQFGTHLIYLIFESVIFLLHLFTCLRRNGVRGG